MLLISENIVARALKYVNLANFRTYIREIRRNWSKLAVKCRDNSTERSHPLLKRTFCNTITRLYFLFLHSTDYVWYTITETSVCVLLLILPRYGDLLLHVDVIFFQIENSNKQTNFFLPLALILYFLNYTLGIIKMQNASIKE